MTNLEVKEDGQIWLIPDCPKEPKKWEQGDSLSYNEAAWQFYKEALASAERILVSNQDVARELLFLKHCIFPKEIALKEVAGLYPIPDLKWEPRTVEKFYESKGWFWEKVAVISLPLESTPSTEQQPFNGCSPTACGCKSLADCPNNQPLAVATITRK